MNKFIWQKTFFVHSIYEKKKVKLYNLFIEKNIRNIYTYIYIYCENFFYLCKSNTLIYL